MDPLELYFWLALCAAGLLGLLLGYVVWEILHRTDPHSTKPRLHAAHPRYDVLDEAERILQEHKKRI